MKAKNYKLDNTIIKIPKLLRIAISVLMISTQEKSNLEMESFQLYFNVKIKRPKKLLQPNKS